MALKSIFAAVCCAAILAAGSSWADEYRPHEFLSLDLSKAALSPKPLGPPAQFEPRQAEAKTDARSEAVAAAPVHVDPPKPVNAMPKAVAKIRVGHMRGEKRRSVVHAKPV